jgi:hypothetical protein
MTWIDELQEEMRRRQYTEQQDAQSRTEGNADEAVTDAQRLVRNLLDQMNRELLAGRGSVWETNVRWGIRLWELWWRGTRTEGQHIVVTLLRDSRGTPYLKTSRRRLALQDPMLERRLQRALQAAFLQPSVFTPRVHGQPKAQEVSWPAQGADRSEVVDADDLHLNSGYAAPGRGRESGGET